MIFFSLRRRKFVWQKIRIEAGRWFQRLWLGMPGGDLPSVWIRTVAGGYFRESMQEHLVKVHQLQPPVIARYPFEEHYTIKFRRDKAFDAVHVYEFKDTYVSPYSGIAFLPEGWVLEESAGPMDKVLNWGKLWPELLLTRTNLDVDAPILVVPAAPFFHFVWEHLPLLIQTLARLQNVKLLLPENPPRFVREYLTLFLPDWEQRAIYGQNVVRVPTLLVPQVESFSGFIHPAYPAVLHQTYHPTVQAEPEFTELAYISRRKAPSRHMRHEDEMEEALIQMGFKVYFLEELTVAEQMKAFYRAKMILAPHGAGLSHLFMAKAGTYVLEIFPADYFNDCYARLSVSLGHFYDHVICKHDTKWEGGMMPVDNILVRVAEQLEIATTRIGA